MNCNTTHYRANSSSVPGDPTWGRTTIDAGAAGNVNVTNLQALLESPTGGTELCDGGYNPFGIQPLSDDCVEFLNETGFTSTEFTQNIAQAYITGEIAQLPAGALTIVGGVESRRFTYNFDPGALAGPIAGFNTATVDGGTNSFFDIFGEALIPILRDRPWAESLEIGLGFRRSRSDFNDIVRGIDGDPQSSWAYKVELSWAPIPQARVRASYQRSVRAPNFGELFSGGSAFVQIFDPCSIDTNFRQEGGAAARAFCIGTGVPASGVDAFVALPGSQINLGFSGNRELEPEKANTLTAGVVFNYAGFTASIDYYNIKINDPIFGPNTNLIVAACYGYQGNFNPNLDPNNTFCQAARRAGGNFTNFNGRPLAASFPVDAAGNLTLANLGGLETSGIDVQVAYRLPTEFIAERSAISFNLLLNYLINYKVDELPGVTLDYAGSAGYFGAGISQSFPRWRGNLNIDWNFGDGIGISTRLRYIHSMVNRASIQFPGEPQFTGPDSVIYTDVALSAQFENVQFRIGLNNAFNVQPPLYNPNQQSGTDPSTYDVVGRRGFVSARLRF